MFLSHLSPARAPAVDLTFQWLCSSFRALYTPRCKSQQLYSTPPSPAIDHHRGTGSQSSEGVEEKCVQMLKVKIERILSQSMLNRRGAHHSFSRLWVWHTDVHAQRNVQSIMVVMICVSHLAFGESRTSFFQSTNCKSTWGYCSVLQQYHPRSTYPLQDQVGLEPISADTGSSGVQPG